MPILSPVKITRILLRRGSGGVLPRLLLLLLLHVGKRKSRVLGRLHHLLHLDALIVQREPMGQSRFRVVEPQRHLVQLVASVSRRLPCALPQRLHLGGGHRLLSSPQLSVLPPHFPLVYGR